MSTHHGGDSTHTFSGNADNTSVRRRRLPLSPTGAKNVEISLMEIRRCLEEFSRELKNLSDKVMRLGRVSGLLWSTKRLQRQLVETEAAFTLNAASLNSDVYHSGPHCASLVKGREYDQLPDCLQELAWRLQDFRDRLEEFHERTDETATLCRNLNSFIRNVKYRGHCIDHYRGRLNTIPIQQYVHQLAHELATGLRDLLPSLEAFNAIGIPAIRYEQERASGKFTNISTVATLFSSVTATTLQMSISLNSDSIEIFIVNVLWLCALIFSVGATLNSLLSMAWRQARTGSRAPPLISRWISSSPVAFLVLAICSFSAGLVVFAYASNQAIFTAPLTVAATAVTFIGLIGVAFGILYERWTSNRRHKSDETDVDPSQDDVASMVTVSTDSLAKSEGDWFKEEEEQSNDSSHTPPEKSAAPRFKQLTRKIGIQHIVLTKLNRRQPSQYGPPSPIPKDPATRRLKSVAHAVAQHSSRPRAVNHISSISIAKRHGLVRYSQFSPTSHHLAVTCVKEERFSVSTWTAIYDIQSDPVRVADMWHEGETTMHGKGLTWSPDGKEVLVNFDRELHMWDYSQHDVRTLRTRHTIKAVIWLDANTILTAESSRIHKRSRSHRTMEIYDLQELSIRGMAMEPTHNYLVILARVKAPSQETSPTSEEKRERSIVVYDMDQKTMVYRLPVLEDIVSIQISRSGLRMLINSHEQPFQVWEFDANLDSSNLRVTPVLRRLTIVHCDESIKERCSGPVTFGGMNDDFVFSMTEAGKIRVWQRSSSTLEVRSRNLLSLALGESDEEAPMIQQLAWRPSSPTFAITRYNIEGASIIQLWTVKQPASTRSTVPIIRTTTSQGSTLSQESSTGEPDTQRLSVYTPGPTSRSPASPSVALGLADIAAQVSSRHMQSVRHTSAPSTTSMV